MLRFFFLLNLYVVVFFNIYAQVPAYPINPTDSFLFYQNMNHCYNSNYNLVWNDEFDGNEIDNSKWWTFIPRWYIDNNGAWHTDDSMKESRLSFSIYENDACLENKSVNCIFKDENIVVSKGTCKINNIYESCTWYGYTRPYSSGYLQSKVNFNKYGRYEIRAKLPKGIKILPAFWLHGQRNYNNNTSTNRTEIDMFEFFKSGMPNWVMSSTVHHDFGPKNKTKNYRQEQKYSINNELDKEWHIYAVEFDTFEINFYFDSVKVNTVNRYIGYKKNGKICTSSSYKECFYDNKCAYFKYNITFPWCQLNSDGLLDLDPLNVILNNCVLYDCRFKKNNGINPRNTELSSFEIDYVRVYEKKY